jgi:dipeptidase D
MEFDLSKRHCYYFNEIAKIPHGSRNEKALSDYIVSFAKAHGYAWKQDEVFNVLVDKPASPGYEDCAPVILQAHIDMVNEKNKDSGHDFDKDPLDLYVDEEGWLHARGTTLGADDGSGAAYMLAILDDPDLKHPPIQCNFTTMEEIGLIGASSLKAEDFHGKKLINLDSGGEVETTVSSAGGARAQIICRLQKEAKEAGALTGEPTFRRERR